MRFLGFFLLVFAALWLLRQVPFIGRIFDVPLLGFYLAAIVVSVVLARLATVATDRRRIGVELRRLEVVDTPHNRGKLGCLHLQASRPRRAIDHLEAAVAGEPEVVEWRYRLGLAYLRGGRAADAVVALRGAAQIDEEHAYGAVLLSLARAQQKVGSPEEALETVERLERNSGPSPESAYLRGQFLKASGDKDRARAAFGEVGELAFHAPKYQRAQARGWALRAFWARLF